MPLASRVSDIHLCPTHGPNPIVTGSPNTITSGMPAARDGDLTACGAILIVSNHSVYINGRLAGRLGDRTSHGGTITTGAPDVLIGEPIPQRAACLLGAAEKGLPFISF